MNRRRFLTLAVSATAGFAAVGTWRWTTGDAPQREGFVHDDGQSFEARVERLESVLGDDDRALILALAPDLESAIAVAQHAEPVDRTYSDETVVLGRLRTTLLAPWRSTNGDLDALVDTYRAAVARDHRDGRVVVLDGWFLAATRVDVCVLASLVRERVGASMLS